MGTDVDGCGCIWFHSKRYLRFACSTRRPRRSSEYTFLMKMSVCMIYDVDGSERCRVEKHFLTLLDLTPDLMKQKVTSRIVERRKSRRSQGRKRKKERITAVYRCSGMEESRRIKKKKQYKKDH